jgi:hypothetical protein
LQNEFIEISEGEAVAIEARIRAEQAAASGD